MNAISPAHGRRPRGRRLAASVEVPAPIPDGVTLPPSPHPQPPASPTPPEIIEPPQPGQIEPVREPILPTPGDGIRTIGRWLD